MKSDVVVAKNYLTEEELCSLEHVVSAYLDLAEDRARRHIPMTMADWAKRLDLFLMADDRAILTDAGSITAEIAKAHAETEFEFPFKFLGSVLHILQDGTLLDGHGHFDGFCFADFLAVRHVPVAESIAAVPGEKEKPAGIPARLWCGQKRRTKI